MKHTRIIVPRYGGPDALQVLEEERPEPKHGQVRVRVLCAGVALPDVMAREGIHPETPRVPFTPWKARFDEAHPLDARRWESFLDFHCPGCRAPVRLIYEAGAEWAMGVHGWRVTTILESANAAQQPA